MDLDLGLRFRELLKRPQGVFGFGVANANDAAVAVAAGMECVYAGGYSIALATGRPDLQLTSPDVVKRTIADIARRVSVPVIADLDEGYGNALNLEEHIEDTLGREYIDLETWQKKRLAGIHVEDQVYPKLCGHIAGRKTVTCEEAAGKFRMAVKVRDILYPNAVLIARTDAYNSKVPESMDEAIRRAVAYARAGADLAWCEFNQTDRETVSRFPEGIHREIPDYPLAFNYSPNLEWYKDNDPIPFSELNAMGYKFVFVTVAAAHSASYAVFEYAKRFGEVGAQALWEMQEKKVGHPTESAHKMGRVPLYKELSREFIPNAAEREREGEGFKVEKGK